MPFDDGYIAVDWGTTNRRAYSVARDGTVGESFSDARGLMAVPAGGFPAAAAEITTRLGNRPMLLAGMVGSNRGWREAAYVPCPADLDAVARAILWIEPGRVGIVPGVSQTGADGADVMRGEEVQVIGAVATGLAPTDCLICHPGTHTKWISMATGRIHRFVTMMTGELFALIKTHSILGPQLQDEVAANADFLRGAAEGLDGRDLVPTLFGIRARHLLGETQDNPAAYVSGLLIGSDVRAGLALDAGAALILMGRPDLCTLYRAALATIGRDAQEVDGAAAFLAGIHHLTGRL